DGLFAERDGAHGAAAADLLFQRLGLDIGDRIVLGGREYELRSRILTEPDAISDGFGLAPRLMVSLDGLRASGLVQPGSLVEYGYKVRLPEGAATEAAIEQVRTQATEDFPEAGWSIRARTNAAPSLAGNVARFSQFLTLVGLTALVVGGVGVANAVRAYLESKRGVIATFKSLGASGGFVFIVYLVQILMIAVIGVAAGVVIGAAMPFLATAFLSSLLPLPAEAGIYPGALAVGVLFGLMVTLVFALMPLGRARDIPATALFREMGFEARGWPRAVYVMASVSIAVLLALFAIWWSNERLIAVIFIGGMAFAFIVLRSVGTGLQWLARRSPRVRST
ncbi:MAG: FtsX-like permease family protein, partial [Dehalococcoidia bacterium]